jgi:hypothetical protein
MKLLACVALSLLLFSTDGFAQTGPVEELDSYDGAIVWGHLFGGMTENADKRTFKSGRFHAARLIGWWTSYAGMPSLSGGQTTSTSGGARRIGIQVVGGVQVARHSFGNGAGGFTTLSLTAGPRLLFPPQPKYRLYVQGLAGIQRSFGSTAPAIAPEVGVILPMGKWLVTVNGGIETAFYEGGSDTGVNLLAGLTLPLGQRQ